MNTIRDKIYARPHKPVGDFTFDERVANVFPDMIKRSVPGYDTVLSMLSVLSGEYAQKDSNIYDLGCSLGAATLALRRHIRQPNCRIFAVDNSPAMLARCRQHIEADVAQAPVHIVCADVRDVLVRQASVVVLNFTLQFIPQAEREQLMTDLYAGILPGGALILSEKIAFDSEPQQELNNRLHHAFKRENGYSELEISQKRTALENVLIPETMQTHLERLRLAGFSHGETWFRCLNFISILAVK